MVMNFFALGQHPESELAKARRLGDEDALVKTLDRITVMPSAIFYGWNELTDLLRDTRSQKIRAAVAMTLADLSIRDAAPIIISVISRSDVIRSSGTLLFALNELNASIPLDLIVSIIEVSSFEARAEALTFMEEIRVTPYKDADRVEAAHRLKAVQKNSDLERADAASLALDYLGYTQDT